jgi:hypothetical protein
MRAMKRIRDEATAVINAPGSQDGESFVEEFGFSVMYAITFRDCVK